MTLPIPSAALDDRLGFVGTSGSGEYRHLVERSVIRYEPRGTDRRDMPAAIREHQRHAVDFSLGKGSAALFLDTGLGKSLCAFAYAGNVEAETRKPVLMLSPLGVTGQHYSEARKFGFDAVTIARSAEDVQPGLNLCNYERLHLFDPGQFGGLILDESSTRHFDITLATCILTLDGPEWSHRYADRAHIPMQYWRDLGPHPEHKDHHHDHH